MEGSVETQAGPAPRVSSSLRLSDRLGAWKARWRIGRMHYTVDPGLYALGLPTPRSPVFVTANYKMSFDRLREALPGFDAWILVLDTRGINVWCAAGKGTFGTEELVRRIGVSRLGEILSHRQLILPQLGAPGIAAHEVRERSGFRVVYGPVAARDLPAFMAAGMKATAAMRTKTFPLAERLALVPVELLGALMTALPSVAALAIFSFLLSGLSAAKMVLPATIAALTIGLSILSGAILTPALLPWLPGRAFSLKGILAGLVVAAAAIIAGRQYISGLTMLVLMLSVPSMSAFLAMNFTGSSTFTSLSGVKREMRWALPVEIGGTAAGLTVWIVSLVLGGS